MLSNNSACSALGTKPKTILSKVGAAVVAGASKVSTSSVATGSSTVSSAEPPQAVATNARQSRSSNDFFYHYPPLAYNPILHI